MATIVRQRRDTEANWTSSNPVIPDGQLVFDKTNNTFRIGNGINNYLDLPLQSGTPGASGGLQAIVEDTTPELGGNLSLNGFDIPVSPSVEDALDLKAPIASPTFTGTVTAQIVTGALLKGSSYTQANSVVIGAGTHPLDYSLGDMQQVTVTGDITLAFSNFPSGKVASMIVDFVNAGAYTFTYPVGTIFATKAEPPYTETGVDRVLVIKDATNTYGIFVIGKDIGVVA